ncbi:hypothetical protein ACEQ8H_004412 [Pleosporales sp. CAS-2024a]
MAPLRRYLRITKHSVLEVRIYLDRPADADAWLLKRDDPALSRVIQAVRPLVLPKLREENERGKSKGGAKAKKKDDFEVSIFLTELSSRHSVLTKQKSFKARGRIQSNSGKLTSWVTSGTSDQPVLINEDVQESIVIREEEDEEGINMADLPQADEHSGSARDSGRGKRGLESAEHDAVSDKSGSDSSALFVPGGCSTRNQAKWNEEAAEAGEDKKKVGLKTSYDGFSIYGRILCLVVKRRGVRSSAGGGPASSQQMLENWVSTQAAAEHDDEEDIGG